MTLAEFISFFSIVSAFLGTVFFVKGFLKITPDVIVAQSRTWCGSNPYTMQSICSQKSNIICGFILVLIATTLQLTSLFIDKKTDFNDSKIISLAIIGGVTVLLHILFLFIDNQYTKFTLEKAKKTICAQDFQKYINDNTINDIEYKAIEDAASFRLGLRCGTVFDLHTSDY